MSRVGWGGISPALQPAADDWKFCLHQSGNRDPGGTAGTEGELCHTAEQGAAPRRDRKGGTKWAPNPFHSTSQRCHTKGQSLGETISFLSLSMTVPNFHNLPLPSYRRKLRDHRGCAVTLTLFELSHSKGMQQSPVRDAPCSRTRTAPWLHNWKMCDRGSRGADDSASNFHLPHSFLYPCCHCCRAQIQQLSKEIPFTLFPSHV